jgi:hypothetical protein
VTIGLTEGEITTPPGADDPHASWRDALRPRWRQVAVLAGAALLAGVALLALLPRPHAGAVKRIDPSATFERAQKLAAFPVYVPGPLPAGWVPTNAHLDSTIGKARIEVGYQSPDFGYVGLEETDAPARGHIMSQITAGGLPEAAYRIGDLIWVQEGSSRRTLESLVWYGPTSQVVVTGTASLANLKTFVASLQLT